MDLGTDILGGGSVGPFVRVRYVGGDTANWEGVGQIPSQGDPQYDRGGKSDREGQNMGITTYGGRDGGSKNAGGGDPCLLPPEHGRTAHCDQAHYVPVSRGGADTRDKGIQAVVITGRGICGRDEDGGLGSGTDKGGGGYVWDGDKDGLNWWEDSVANTALGTDPNAPIDYAPKSKHHYPIMSMLGYHGGRLHI